MTNDFYSKLNDQFQAGYRAGGKYLFIGIERYKARGKPETYRFRGAQVFYDREPESMDAIGIRT